jgi:hypothetical protein
MDTTPCRYCGLPIAFVRTAAGALMPLDPQEDAEGNVVLVDGHAKVVGPRDLFSQDEGPRYKTHFATCKLYRRKKP